MKLRIKLNKEESEAFKAFADVVRPEEVTEDQFLKSIFLHGIEAMNNQLIEMTKQFVEENRESLEASGYSVDTEGDVAVVSSPSGSVDIIKNIDELDEEE